MTIDNNFCNAYGTPKKSYSKKWLSYEDQYNLLLERGMSFDDYTKEKALKKLEFIGYYRLSGYSYDFRNFSSIGHFLEGTQFKDIIELYKFDRKLRLLILDAVERIEVALRASLAHYATKKSVMFLDDDLNFNLNRIINSWANRKQIKRKGGIPKEITVKKLLYDLRLKVKEKIQHRRFEPAIEHLLSNYKEPYPLWIVIQIFDFSDLCVLYQILDKDLAKEISGKFGIKSPKTFVTWLQSIRHVRNICAHHSRLLNRNLSFIPRIPNVINDYKWIALWGTTESIDTNKIFVLICVLHHILKYIEASRSWDKRLVELFSEFPKIKIEKFDSVEKVMGCPKEWKKLEQY